MSNWTIESKKAIMKFTDIEVTLNNGEKIEAKTSSELLWRFKDMGDKLHIGFSSKVGGKPATIHFAVMPLDEDAAEFLGVAIGDGKLFGRRQIAVAACEEMRDRGFKFTGTLAARPHTY